MNKSLGALREFLIYNRQCENSTLVKKLADECGGRFVVLNHEDAKLLGGIPLSDLHKEIGKSPQQTYFDNHVLIHLTERLNDYILECEPLRKTLRSLEEEKVQLEKTLEIERRNSWELEKSQRGVIAKLLVEVEAVHTEKWEMITWNLDYMNKNKYFEHQK